MKVNIKHVFRIGVEETNSSSTHTIVVGGKNDLVKRGDPDLGLNIGEDNILRIPWREEFGWEYAKSNRTQTKIQYAAALLCRDIKTTRGQKSIMWFKNLLKHYLGVDDVVFEWEDNYKETLKEAVDNSGELSPSEISDLIDSNYTPTEINHQSWGDANDVILENKDTLIRFMFSRGSWWYGGNDNSDAPVGFYKEIINLTIDEEPKVCGMASIDFGFDIGRVDIPLHLGCDYLHEISSYPIISGIAWSTKQGKPIKINPYASDIRSMADLMSVKEEISYINDNGVPTIVFTGGKEASEKISAWISKTREERKRSGLTFSSLMAWKTAFERRILVKDEDYKEYPAKITLYEFGDIV